MQHGDVVTWYSSPSTAQNANEVVTVQGIAIHGDTHLGRQRLTGLRHQPTGLITVSHSHIYTLHMKRPCGALVLTSIASTRETSHTLKLQLDKHILSDPVLKTS